MITNENTLKPDKGIYPAFIHKREAPTIAPHFYHDMVAVYRPHTLTPRFIVGKSYSLFLFSVY